MLLSTPGWILLVGATRLVGRLIALVTSTFALNALLVIAVIAVLAALDKWAVSAGKPGEPETWLTASRVLGIWALVLIAGWVLRQRRRLVVARFDDLGGDKSGTPGASAGMSVLLASELTQLRDLFQEFEEGYAVQTPAGDTRSQLFEVPIQASLFKAAIQVDTQGGFLESAVSAESTLAVGPLKIPINIFLGLVNRLVQGPRISGQVQNDGGRRIVTIDLTVGPLYRQWLKTGPTCPCVHRPIWPASWPSEYSRSSPSRIPLGGPHWRLWPTGFGPIGGPCGQQRKRGSTCSRPSGISSTQ